MESGISGGKSVQDLRKIEIACSNAAVKQMDGTLMTLSKCFLSDSVCGPHFDVTGLMSSEKHTP